MFPKGHNNILKCWPRDIYFTVIEKKKPENIGKKAAKKLPKSLLILQILHISMLLFKYLLKQSDDRSNIIYCKSQPSTIQTQMWWAESES